jgi:hypothetical protein
MSNTYKPIRALPGDWLVTRSQKYWTPAPVQRKFTPAELELIKQPVVIATIVIDDEEEEEEEDEMEMGMTAEHDSFSPPCIDLTDDSMDIDNSDNEYFTPSQSPQSTTSMPTFAEAYSGCYGAAPSDYTSSVQRPHYEMTAEDIANDALLYGY